VHCALFIYLKIGHSALVRQNQYYKHLKILVGCNVDGTELGFKPYLTPNFFASLVHWRFNEYKKMVLRTTAELMVPFKIKNLTPTHLNQKWSAYCILVNNQKWSVYCILANIDDDIPC
jgi:hypothetical protein